MGIFKRNDKQKLIFTLVSMMILALCMAFASKQGIQAKNENEVNQNTKIESSENIDNKKEDENNSDELKESGIDEKFNHENAIGSLISLKDIPKFSNKPYAVINNNKPYFTEKELSNRKSFESYSELDGLNRCGTAIACIGKDLMPTQERGAIGSVKPTGWQTAKYDVVDGKYLYNRCHLIGFQLTAENANEKNLITGTRYLNVEGMLPFENMVADYIKETSNHVLYRVTPIFDGNNLVASGVLMEARSIEDNGKGIEFNIYCYNNQPKIMIDYSTGESFELDNKGNGNKNLDSKTKAINKDKDSEKGRFFINKSTKKIHKPDCTSVKESNSKNIEEYNGKIIDLLNQGYERCKKCNP